MIAFVQTGADNDWRNAHTVSVKEAAAGQVSDNRGKDVAAMEGGADLGSHEG